VDRSPTGSGVQTRLALHAARVGAAACVYVSESHATPCALALTDRCWVIRGAVRRYASLTGGVFTGRIDAVVSGAPDTTAHPQVTVEVAGKAHYTGQCQFVHEPDDPLAVGFLLS
jgi:proline racemase